VRLVIVRPGLKCAAYEKKGTPSFLLSGIKGLQEGRSIGERKENKPTDVGNRKVGSINLGKTRSLSICKRRRKQVESRAEGGRSGFDHPLLVGIRGTAQKRHGRT
jgi:hypothetical protein